MDSYEIYSFWSKTWKLHTSRGDADLDFERGLHILQKEVGQLYVWSKSKLKNQQKEKVKLQV